MVLEVTTRGAVPVPDAMPAIGGRLGIDRTPIDVTDPIEARWLEACVWPDQADRFHRLRAAIELATTGAAQSAVGRRDRRRSARRSPRSAPAAIPS